MWQRCAVHFYRNVWTAVTASKVKEVAAKLKEMKLADAAALVVAGIEETLYCYLFPREHGGICKRTTRWNAFLREVQRRKPAGGRFRMASRH